MLAEEYNASQKKEDYGIEGYKAMKTCNYFEKAFKFPQAKRKDLTYEAKKHAKEPGPTTYIESYEKSFKKY